MKIYICASWKMRNHVRILANKLRASGHEVFDFTDQARRVSRCIPPEASAMPPFDPARHVYAEYINQEAWWEAVSENRARIEASDAVMLLLPCGNDAHMDFGYGLGLGLKSLVIGAPNPGDRSPTHLWADHMVQSLAEAAQWACSAGQPEGG